MERRDGTYACPVIIQANATDAFIAINSGDTLTIKVSLEANAYAGSNVDCWAAALTPDGAWYYFDCLNAPAQWRSGLAVTLQGPLGSLDATDLLTISNLASGTYTFYFGVDTMMDGQVTTDRLFYDTVVVTVH